MFIFKGFHRVLEVDNARGAACHCSLPAHQSCDMLAEELLDARSGQSRVRAPHLRDCDLEDGHRRLT